jgi:hypothetical protein
MKNTQNQKISQIKNETLVVGIEFYKFFLLSAFNFLLFFHSKDSINPFNNLPTSFALFCNSSY